MLDTATYDATKARVEDYFDRSATTTWERLTSDAPVSKVRQTVREGRDRMRALMLSQLPDDLTGARVLDAGCGTGQMSLELAQRGADVLALDISPSLIRIARERHASPRISFLAGDMLNPEYGRFHYVLAMDSLIYYANADLVGAVERLAQRADEAVVFTIAPRTAFLLAFWGMGKLFPRSNRSPIMVPQSAERLGAQIDGLSSVGRVTSGFYISECVEVRE